MNYSKALLVSALVAMSSGVAFAQAGGGNGNGGNSGTGGSGNAHGAATAAPTTGGSASTGAMSSGSGSMKMHHKSSKTKKPMTDSTNTPGADASSDTKGQ